MNCQAPPSPRWKVSDTYEVSWQAKPRTRWIRMGTPAEPDAFMTYLDQKSLQLDNGTWRIRTWDDLPDDVKQIMRASMWL